MTSVRSTETATLLDVAHGVIERAYVYPGEIEFSAPFLACVGTVPGHTDEWQGFPQWSAFLCLRNEGCRVWSKVGYSGIPSAGDYFTINIHRMHGVRAPRKLAVLAVICADGNTEQAAKRKLRCSIREQLREARR